MYWQNFRPGSELFQGIILIVFNYGWIVIVYRPIANKYYRLNSQLSDFSG